MSEAVQAFLCIAFMGGVMYLGYYLLDKYDDQINNFLEYIYLKFLSKPVKNIELKINIAKQISIKDWDRIWKETGQPSCKEIKFDITTSSNRQDFINFLREHRDNLNWEYICHYCTFDEKVLNEFKDYLNLTSLQVYKTELPESFIRRWIEEFNLQNLLMNQTLSEDFLRDRVSAFKKVHWACISRWQKLSENFIREFKQKVRWTNIVLYQNVSLDFVLEHKKKVNWVEVSMEKLTEEQMEKYKDLLEWVYVCGINTIVMSDEFIKKHEKYMVWGELRHRHLSKDLKMRYGHLIWGGYVEDKQGLIG